MLFSHFTLQPADGGGPGIRPPRRPVEQRLGRRDRVEIATHRAIEQIVEHTPAPPQQTIADEVLGRFQDAHLEDPSLSLRPLAGIGEVAVVRIDGLDKIVDPLAFLGAGGDHRDHPGRGFATEAAQAHHRSQIGDGFRRVGAIALGDGMDVGNFENARLDRLNLIAQPRRRDDDHRVRRLNDIDLVLADADSLDEDNIEPAGIENIDDVMGGAGKSAERAARGQAADEHSGVAGQLQHADPVAEDGAAGERAGRIDGDDADGASGEAQPLRQRPHHRRLAGPGDAGQADDVGAPRGPVDLCQELPAAARDGALGDRHGAGDRLAPAGQNVVDEPGVRRLRLRRRLSHRRYVEKASVLRDNRRRGRRNGAPACASAPDPPRPDHGGTWPAVPPRAVRGRPACRG